MGIGAAIFLIAAGAILTFAVDWHIADVDLDIVGWILMAAGAAGLIITTVIWGRRRSAAVPPPPGDVGEEPVYRRETRRW
ncbi:hypothetical protein Afil01_63310 [Actinorhabdospora filicis]|uniref:DUF6458 domain-containing protein n=1 Tax=Actinorhabdospora filicis TaxID=1785913 RepID=A0A9W6SRD3_9ACTN|nr:DUF6458 family protein [Actinorhabdospora filicis]GLZ81524.1 hypothetical protein Afil01_63310 [Actinorhabdospora filicis]